jgi:formylmethanofuran dehydrogenase subunit D
MTQEQIKKLIQDYSSFDRYPNTDKGSYHAYEEYYSEALIPYLDKKINLLEVGVAGGVSLKMWQEIMPKAKIYGSDANYGYLQYPIEEFSNMVLLPQGDQTDENVFKDIPLMDIIIDDASHIVPNTIGTFNILKNKLNINGIYIIEDVSEEQLKEYPVDFLKNFEIIDLRKYKNRGDDILLVYNKGKENV